MPKALVVGALGVVGRANVEYFTTLPDWSVVALSRRAPDFVTPAQFISCNVTDPSAVRTALARHPDITHVVFAALHEQPAGLVAGWSEADTVRTNVAMLANALDVLDAVVPSMRHFALMHGGKAYGVHLGPPPSIPSRETDARTMRPNFYYDQEDLLRERQRGKSWSWTILRPPAVVGFAVGSLLSTILVLGVFAAISRELGIALRFPGAIGHLKDACDARLLAKAVHWAGQTPAAANEIFNISNGDCFLFEQVFPRIAEVFAMPCGAPHPMSLARVMGDKGPVWDDIVRKYQLRPYRLRDLVPSWEYADFTFRYRQAPFEIAAFHHQSPEGGFPGMHRQRGDVREAASRLAE